MCLRILLVDDHEVVRLGVRALIEDEPGMEVVGEAGTIQEALSLANELQPVYLSRRQFTNLMDFLHALTDPSSIDLRNDIPKRVPSGLTLAE